MAAATKLYSVSSLLMAFLFAASASFQFNDIDWYLWIPLYAIASAVNLMSFWSYPAQSIQNLAKLPLWLGAFLFIKLSVAGDQIWSLDMRERESREKFGSGLVLVSMILQLAASSSHQHHQFDMIQSFLYSGMRMIVGLVLICGAALVFLVLLTGSMIMHSASSTVQDDSVVSWKSKLEYFVDFGTVLLIGTNYSLFFVVSVLFITCMTILRTPKSLVKNGTRHQASIGYGMAALVVIGYGLSLVLHVYHKDQMNFDGPKFVSNSLTKLVLGSSQTTR